MPTHPIRAPSKIYNKFRKYFPFTCVDLLVFNGDVVLLTKRTINPYKNMWHLPGTMIRKHEKMHEAIRRSAREELNVSVKIVRYIGVYESHNKFRHDISHPFLVSISNIEKIKTDFQSEQMKFFKRLPKNTIPHHKKAVSDARKILKKLDRL